MRQRRAYVIGNELLLLIQDADMFSWVPDVDAMMNYRQGLCKIFKPYDDLVITVAGLTMVKWPLLQEEEHRDIAAILEHPWIPLGEAIGPEVSEEEIPAFMEGQTIDYLRPQLVYENVPVQVIIHRQPPIQSVNPSGIPVHVARILLERAAADGYCCPITGDAITATNGHVTCCGHLFETEAIHRWLTTKNTCPECRQICRI